MKIALYPGSFDPVTNGHVDIVKRASKIFDKVIVCVANNPDKKYTFSKDERLELVKESCKEFKNVEAIYTDDLVVNAARKVGASVIIRGLRALTDFEFEFQFAAANAFIDKEIEMMFLMTSSGYEFISSSNVKEFVSKNVDVSALIPPCVDKALKEKYKK